MYRPHHFYFIHHKTVTRNTSLCFPLRYSRKAFVFICLRSVYTQWFKQTFLEALLPLSFLGFAFTEGKKLDRRWDRDQASEESASADWMKVKAGYSLKSEMRGLCRN